MSKIGNAPITVPSGVQITVNEQAKTVSVSSPQGSLTYPLPHHVQVEVNGNVVNVKRLSEGKEVKALHGMLRSLLNNAVQGLVKPWEKRLEIVGTGYNAKLEGQNLVLKVGYSHLVTVPKVDGITFTVEGGNKIVVKGVDRQKVGEIAYKIKMIKKPDPYKGKGIRYEGEHIKLKAGKKAKAGA